MFGKNPIRPLVTSPLGIAVTDIFGPTIQGEGPLSGMRAIFARLAGCNLACHFCDTEFETGVDNPRTPTDIVEEIIQRFTPAQRALVVVTGGEPMRQNWSLLAHHLFASGTQIIQVETAGTVWHPDFDSLARNPNFMIVCSPKTPKVNARIAEVTRHWKYVVRAGELAEDGLPNRGTQVGNMHREQMLFRPDRAARGWRDTIWVSPCDDYDEVKNRANRDAARDSCLKHGYRLSLQVHKLVDVA